MTDSASFDSRRTPPRVVGVPLADLALSLGSPEPIESVRVTGASDDSRTVMPGDLYMALPGTHVH
ncbi:hypothetical protein [Rhodococcus sp. BS-15]|uniref:hypothetical protein n=1 Tax=Rhodococcus sp. BS-15 TaxID=1304954 RepID=UPI000A4F0F66|nr:hypothetical protein [Rhodococcus sp. BS-15]